MGELFFGLLLEIAGIVLEALLEFGVGASIAALSRSAPVASRTLGKLASGLTYLLFGLMAGWVSVVVLPHPLVPRARIRGLSLVVSPVLTGAAMAASGNALRRKGKRTARIETFGYGFAFALGMAFIRFLFVK
jgi:hypothetical protein